MILKSLWTHKKQNGWIFAEIALIACLGWFIVDYLVVTFYATHLCIPAGEFEKDHLCVGQMGVIRSESTSEDYVTEEEARGIYVIRDKLASLPEVASVCFAPDYLGANLNFYNWRTLALADDTTRTIGFSQFFYYENERFFETQGLRAIDGSPDAETLSRQIAPDGIVVTRSVARLTPTLTKDFRAGICVLNNLETYRQHYDSQVAHDYSMYTTLATIPLVLFAIIVVLGTLGTFWLQIRKRTEDIGIMRSFGAKRRDIFLQIWGEAALLTVTACLTGCLVWFQFAIHWDLLSNGKAYGSSGLETDWVVQFWPHFLIVSAVQCLLLLAVVTLGMVVPTVIAMYKRPVEALRHE